MYGNVWKRMEMYGKSSKGLNVYALEKMPAF